MRLHDELEHYRDYFQYVPNKFGMICEIFVAIGLSVDIVKRSNLFQINLGLAVVQLIKQITRWIRTGRKYIVQPIKLDFKINKNNGRKYTEEVTLTYLFTFLSSLERNDPWFNDLIGLDPPK